MFLGFPFIILYALINYMAIHSYITCIGHDLGVLGVAWKIQLMSSLQSNE